eukprot:g2605.t1
MGGRNDDRGGRDWLKRKRQGEQRHAVESKQQREIDYFWDLQKSNKRYDKEKGGPPRKGWKRLEEEEKELFEEKAGMAAGIDFDHYNEITVDINGKGVDDIPICDTYEQVTHTFKLTGWLADNIWKCHYLKPTPVQKYAIPTGLKEFDMMVCAQTGSGKTAAFLIPIAMVIKEKDGCEYHRDTWQGPACPLSLVLAPTRELCTQIYDEARKLFHKSCFKVSQCYGGADVKMQLKDLARGTDVLVATPGRLIDFIDRELVSMEYIQFLTLDEADRMLDMGFEPQIRQIVEQRDMPSRNERQTLMFSATFPREIQQLAGSFLKKDYIWISVGRAERERALQNFKSGRMPVLVATEVAARGLDIPKVTKVINFDLPSQVDDYVHRIGRTGRAGNRGIAVSFFNTSDCRNNDTDLAPELCQILDDARETADSKGQEHHWHDIPDWLEDEARRSKNRNKWQKLSSSGKRSGSPRGNRDYRGGGRQIKLKGGGGYGGGGGKDFGKKGGGGKGGFDRRDDRGGPGGFDRRDREDFGGRFGSKDSFSKGGGGKSFGGGKDRDMDAYKGGDRGFGGGGGGKGMSNGFGGGKGGGGGRGRGESDEDWFEKRRAMENGGGKGMMKGKKY